MTRKRNLLVSLGVVLVLNKLDTKHKERKRKKLEKKMKEEMDIILIKIEV